MTNVYEVLDARTDAVLAHWATTEDREDGDVSLWEFQKNEGAWCADNLLDTGALTVPDRIKWDGIVALARLADCCLCSSVKLRFVGTQQ